MKNHRTVLGVILLTVTLTSCQKELEAIQPQPQPQSPTIATPRYFTASKIKTGYWIMFDIPDADNNNVTLQATKSDGTKYTYPVTNGDQNWTLNLNYRDRDYKIELISNGVIIASYH